MHPEILRELVAQHGRELREQAHRAATARTASRAPRAVRRGARRGGRVRRPGHPRLRGRLVPDRRGRGRRPRACRTPRRLRAAVTAPAPAGPRGMPDPRGMLTADEMSGRASGPVLVGRDQQMAALEAAFAGVRQGGPTAVLLGGEAGVGKSRLVGEFGQAATAAGACVLVGGCLELGTDGLPFAPFTAVLRDLVHEFGADAVASMLPGRTTRGLARLLPELGEPDTGPDIRTDRDPGEARARLFEEMLSALDHLARHSPVVLVIEDAHWADRSSRDLLTFLIGNQRAIGGLLIVVTFRSDELHRTHPLRPMLAALDRIAWVERIELPRLTRHDTAELAAGILGRQLAGDVADALYHRSEGNPLFVETLLGRDGELSCGLPESLRDLLLDGVRRLPEDTQEVLRVASAGGQTTGHALLAAVTGLDDAALTGALRPAVTANVLRPHEGGYTFRHELIREAVHDDLLPGEHGRLHSRFAEAIDADPVAGAAGPGHDRDGPPLALGARLGLGADRRVAGRGAGGPGRGPGRAAVAAGPGARAVGPGAGRGRADRRRSRPGAGGGDRRGAGSRGVRARHRAGQLGAEGAGPGGRAGPRGAAAGESRALPEAPGPQGFPRGLLRRAADRARRRGRRADPDPADRGALRAHLSAEDVLRRGGPGAGPPVRRRGERGGRAAHAGHVPRGGQPAGRRRQRSPRADRAGPRHGRAGRGVQPAGEGGGERIAPARRRGPA